MRLSKCNECDEYPVILRDGFWLKTVKIFCPKCGKTTDWSDSSLWLLDAEDQSRDKWNYIVNSFY